MLRLIFATFIILSYLIAYCQKESNVVSINSLMKFTEILSSDSMEGRLPGTIGYNRATNFCVNYFKKHEISSFKEIPNYLQFFEKEHNEIFLPCDFYIYHTQKGKLIFKHGEDYTIRGFSGGGEHTLETVFVGFGIDTTGFNEYETIDARNKAVIMFKGIPKNQTFNLYNFNIVRKVETAIKHGAKAILLIPDPTDLRNKPIGSLMCARGKEYDNFPMLEISQHVASILLEETNLDVKSIYEQITRTTKPASANLNSKIYINIGTKYLPSVKVPNIIGFKKGSNKKYMNQYIIVMAHLDHIGKHCDIIYSGANDNASGCAAVLELARLFSKIRTKRSIIFALVASEEQGLLGAQYFANNLPVKHEQIVAVLNFDCIAVGDSIQLGNGKSNPNLFELAKKLDKSKLLVNSTWSGGGADLTPFYQLRIPGLYFVSKYSYTHLHLPTDKTDTFNRLLFEKIVTLGFEVLYYLSQGQYLKEEILN